MPARWRPGQTEGQTHRAVPLTHSQDRPCQLEVQGPASPSCRALGLLVSSQALNRAPSLRAGTHRHPVGWPRDAAVPVSQPRGCPAWALRGSSGVRELQPEGKEENRENEQKKCYFTKLLLRFYFPARKQTPSQLTLLKSPHGRCSAPWPCPQHSRHGAVLEAAARHSCPLPPQGPAAS